MCVGNDLGGVLGFRREVSATLTGTHTTLGHCPVQQRPSAKELSLATYHGLNRLGVHPQAPPLDPAAAIDGGGSLAGHRRRQRASRGQFMSALSSLLHSLPHGMAFQY